jgi:hypothetical protein
VRQQVLRGQVGIGVVQKLADVLERRRPPCRQRCLQVGDDEVHLVQQAVESLEAVVVPVRLQHVLTAGGCPALLVVLAERRVTDEHHVEPTHRLGR